MLASSSIAVYIHFVLISPRDRGHTLQVTNSCDCGHGVGMYTNMTDLDRVTLQAFVQVEKHGKKEEMENQKE